MLHKDTSITSGTAWLGSVSKKIALSAAIGASVGAMLAWMMTAAKNKKNNASQKAKKTFKTVMEDSKEIARDNVKNLVNTGKEKFEDINEKFTSLRQDFSSGADIVKDSGKDIRHDIEKLQNDLAHISKKVAKQFK